MGGGRDERYPRDWLLPESRDGYAFIERGQHGDALASFQRAYDRAPRMPDDVQACAAAHMIAVQIARLNMDVLERHRWNVTALKHADLAEGERVASWYASLYGSLGVTFRLLGQKDEASEYLERGRALAEALPDDDYGRMVRQAIAPQLRLLAEDGGAAPPSEAL